MRRIGVIGLGRMGHRIARRLTASGYAVTAFDVDAQACDRSRRAGVDVVGSPVDVGEDSDAVIVLVGTDAQVLDVVLGPEGCVHGDGTVLRLAICSTINPRTLQDLADRVPENVSLLDVPLCRSEFAADAGDLLALVGGADEELSAWEPVLGTFCSDIAHLGPLGAGQIAKSLNNYLLWAAVVANSEVMRLGMALDLDQARLREALLLSSGSNWALETWERNRPMPWAEDDLAIVRELAVGLGEATPLVDVVQREISEVKQRKASAGLASASMAQFLEAEDEARSGGGAATQESVSEHRRRRV